MGNYWRAGKTRPRAVWFEQHHLKLIGMHCAAAHGCSEAPHAWSTSPFDNRKRWSAGLHSGRCCEETDPQRHVIRSQVDLETSGFEACHVHISSTEHQRRVRENPDPFNVSYTNRKPIGFEHWDITYRHTYSTRCKWSRVLTLFVIYRMISRSNL